MLENREIAIEVKKLVKTFKNQKVVDALDLTIYKGDIFALLGPNGAGKTTIVRMLATLLKQDSGTIQVMGYDNITEATEIRKIMGLTGQYASIDEELTAYENLMIFCRLNGLKRKEAKVRTTELLTEFSLMESANKKMSKFSGGMRRRLDLAVSLIARPDVIFLDEPTTGLDPRTRNQMWETIRKLVENGSTILLTTQYLEEADQLADQIAVIDKGKLVAFGTADELKALIGGNDLYLKLVHEKDLEIANDILFEILNVRGMIDVPNNEIKVQINQTENLNLILMKLEENRIKINEIAVKKPSLDEVFLKVTET